MMIKGHPRSARRETSEVLHRSTIRSLERRVMTHQHLFRSEEQRAPVD
jgi:hypothetical protein